LNFAGEQLVTMIVTMQQREQQRIEQEIAYKYEQWVISMSETVVIELEPDKFFDPAAGLDDEAYFAYYESLFASLSDSLSSYDKAIVRNAVYSSPEYQEAMARNAENITVWQPEKEDESAFWNFMNNWLAFTEDPPGLIDFIDPRSQYYMMPEDTPEWVYYVLLGIIVVSEVTGSPVRVSLTVYDVDKMAKMGEDVWVSGDNQGAKVNSVKEVFEKWFVNKLQVIHLDQPGRYGQTVGIAALVDLKGMNTNNLVFYN
jgi:hypothetical protein